ncbi:hypothetical protein Acr_27g0007020 [Actinidia rufa]|uniref:Uncharacterized protein n=1 Tax=Actinidia rufa TaxID=165716 RepID=A0A7J0H777_9ERIC|nr:hypothetical protein Acr_27g0007020 [Actinidia rufa]
MARKPGDGKITSSRLPSSQMLDRSWFKKLSSGTIDSFGDLSRLFICHFHELPAVLEVESANDKVVIMAVMEGLLAQVRYLIPLSKNILETQLALQNKADKYIAVEELD